MNVNEILSCNDTVRLKLELEEKIHLLYLRDQKGELAELGTHYDNTLLALLETTEAITAKLKAFQDKPDNGQRAAAFKQLRKVKKFVEKTMSDSIIMELYLESL